MLPNTRVLLWWRPTRKAIMLPPQVIYWKIIHNARKDECPRSSTFLPSFLRTRCEVKPNLENCTRRGHTSGSIHFDSSEAVKTPKRSHSKQSRYDSMSASMIIPPILSTSSPPHLRHWCGSRLFFKHFFELAGQKQATTTPQLSHHEDGLPCRLLSIYHTPWARHLPSPSRCMVGEDLEFLLDLRWLELFLRFLFSSLRVVRGNWKQKTQLGTSFVSQSETSSSVFAFLRFCVFDVP